MTIIPAIDIKEGKVVRLAQGRFDDVTIYSDDPIAMAQKWVDKGAKYLHVIDLDGALSCEMQNFGIISKIAQTVKVPIQAGGGVRAKEDIASLINAGVKRIILSTRILDDLKFLKDVLHYWPNNIAVSLDCANGMIAEKGWTNITNKRATDFVVELENLGLKYLIYTDIKRDGMLSGPNFGGIKQILDNTINISVIASGGLRSIKDINRLLAIKSPRLIGAITGKAIYEGTLDLEMALELCSQKE